MIGGAMLMQHTSPVHAATGTAAMNAAAIPAAVGALATAQAGGEPTIVWYGTYGGNYGGYVGGALLRAWSDGTVEMKKIANFVHNSTEACNANTPCSSPWLVISSPTAGYRAAADLNADEKIDGADLTSILSNWGDAPRVPFPPSDCPLNLVNP